MAVRRRDRHPIWQRTVLAVGVVAALASCADETHPPLDYPGVDASVAPTSTNAVCVPVRSAETEPARLAVMSKETSTIGAPVFTADLFNLFKSSCGGCHVEGGLGGFQVGPLDFADKVDGKVLERIRATNPKDVMPPASAGGKLASERSPGDPILELASLIDQWILAGRPRDLFYRAPEGEGSSSGYRLSESIGNRLTNLGTCIPSPRAFGIERPKGEQLDAYFEKLEKSPPGTGTPAQRVGLPEKLASTDLFTLDSEALAKSGVVSYAPAYPLWSDNARKMRYLRLPYGTSIHFNSKSQEFEIPENSRLYKTFLKRVVDLDGVERYRKLETRLIVARSDGRNADGTAQPRALFGTYAWNDDETEATLVTDPLRNAEPFRDRLITYVTDEPLAQSVRDTNPRNLAYALEDAGAIRRYAIPGSDRCVQCHMGSPTKNFALGLTPLQMRRRPEGEGGVIEATGPDELTQLDRLISYGVVTGLESSAEVAPLEASQLPRTSRNRYELDAQGYVLGNCSHCHNPRGYPSVANPSLAPVLNFLPSDVGGLFQFPLDRSSPRIRRGLGGAIEVPYVSPSLIDFPSSVSTAFWTPKWDISDPKNPNILLAPWRSLIYRNVDTPFTYSDDLALFPHMPMNTPGFDCRAASILGDWMVSIPSVRKNLAIPELAVRTDGQTAGGATGQPGDAVDESAQPYVEILRDDVRYEAAVEQAELRLATYHGLHQGSGAAPSPSRYGFCPDTSDIVDPEVLRDPKRHPVPVDSPRGVIQGEPPTVVMRPDGVPDRAHWVVTDLSEVPGDWTPRRPDWESVLMHGDFPPITGTGPEHDLALERQVAEKRVVAALSSLRISPALRAFATTKVPFGLWLRKPNCTFGQIATVASVDPSSTRWLHDARPAPPPDAPVYSVAPGGAVFGMICINCHGPRADSRGRQAENLMIMTGGEARVADLRDGLFGPTAHPGENRERVFGPASPDSSLEGAHYMAWMALGGTQRTIPQSILAIVGNTEVLGVARPLSPPKDANMLSTAKELCGNVLAPSTPTNSLTFHPESGGYDHLPPLIWANGDADLWTRLCSFDNLPPLRAIYVNWAAETVDLKIRASYGLRSSFDLYPQDGYPSSADVGNDHGDIVQGIASDNLTPWCLRAPADATLRAKATAYAAAHPMGGRPLPICPDAIVPPSGDAPAAGDHHLRGDELEAWATRGAVNAGIAVYLYLEQLTKSGTAPDPRYDQCELLPVGQ